MSSIPENVDFIIVGGGSGGCVMASRLSEGGDAKVLLIEAGQDLSVDKELPAISDPGTRTVFKPEFYWSNLFAEAAPASGGSPRRDIPVMQARLLGGGSAINGMHAQRGFPRDYDEWSEYGVSGWGWDDVRPYFIRLETDRNFNGQDHGTSGPIPITRIPRDRWGGLSLAVEKELQARGLQAQEDLNAAQVDGVGPIPLNISPTTRISSARGYLTPSVRSRPNLTILTGIEVERLLFDGNRVTGVAIVDESGSRRIDAREVILACGAIHSPALLQRSGVGPGETLRNLNVPAVADRRGVGRNLSYHPSLSLNAHVRSKGRPKNTSEPPCLVVARYSSKVPDCPRTDMILNLWERIPSPHVDDPLGRQIADFMFILNKPFSRGDVTANPDPSGRPHIRFNLFEDSRDLDRMVEAVRLGLSLMQSQRLKPLINSAFLMDFSPTIFSYLSDTPEGRRLSRLGGIALGISDLVAKAVLRRMATPVEKLPPDDAGLANLLRSITLTAHPVGTCRLGSADDPDAVVDSRGRVIGVEGLRIADASIFPTVMSAGPNLATMMAAEKIAHHIIRQDN